MIGAPPRRAVFVAVSETLGGGEIILLELAVALSDRLTVAIAGVPDSPLLHEAARRGLPIRSLPLGRKLSKRSVANNLAALRGAQRHLRSLIAETAPDGFTVLQYKWEELLWAGAVDPGRVLLMEHGPIPSPILRVPWAAMRLRTAFARAGAVVATSRPAARSIERLSNRKPSLIRCGVDAQRTTAALRERQRVRRRLGIDDNGTLLVFSSRVAKDKGINELLRAVARMPEAHLVVCGDGPAMAKARGLCADLGLGGRVTFAGHVTNPLLYLAAADASALLTRSPGEGRPQAVLESLAVGTPVLGLSSSVAMRDLAEETHSTGIRLVPSDHPDVVAAGLRALAAGPRATPTAVSWRDVADDFLTLLVEPKE